MSKFVSLPTYMMSQVANYCNLSDADQEYEATEQHDYAVDLGLWQMNKLNPNLLSNV